MAKLNIKPLADRVIVAPSAAETTTASGIIIPDTAQEKPQKGNIVALGNGKKDEPMTVKVGDEGGAGEMFMTLNRRYEQGTGGIDDLTTYVDPSKYNQIFAASNLDSQNFWVQISNKITARRKMSAKVIPNL